MQAAANKFQEVSGTLVHTSEITAHLPENYFSLASWLLPDYHHDR